MANWQILDVWSWCCCCRRPGFFRPQNFFHQFHPFCHCGLSCIIPISIVSCSVWPDLLLMKNWRISDVWSRCCCCRRPGCFWLSVCVCVCNAVPVLGRPLLHLCLHLLCLCLYWVVCCSICVCYSCAWVVYSVCVLCASSAPSVSASAVLCRPLLHLRLRLLCRCLVRVFYDSSAVSVPGSSAPFTFSVPRPLRLRLRLRLLCCVIRCSICVYVCYACASSASSVAHLLFVCLGRLLHLRFLCLVCSVCVCVCCAMSASSSCCVSAVDFFLHFYVISLNQGHLRRVRS